MKIIIRKIKKNYEKQKNNLIKKVIEQYYHIAQYTIVYSKNGKPFVKGNPLYMSISNDNGLFIIVFDENPIGVDLQFFNPIPKSFKSFLKLNDLSDEETIIEFSKREAIIKLEDKTIAEINNINVNNYKILTKINKKYVINIASYNNK